MQILLQRSGRAAATARCLSFTLCIYPVHHKIYIPCPTPYLCIYPPPHLSCPQHYIYPVPHTISCPPYIYPVHHTISILSPTLYPPFPPHYIYPVHHTISTLSTTLYLPCPPYYIYPVPHTVCLSCRQWFTLSLLHWMWWLLCLYWQH